MFSIYSNKIVNSKLACVHILGCNNDIDDSLQTSLFINELNNKMKIQTFSSFENLCLNVISACNVLFCNLSLIII
jgi:hypothetical protein